MDNGKKVSPDSVPQVSLLHIAQTFLGIGLASFSLAALGEAKDWMTKKRRWFSDEEYMQGLGLAQLMPGAPTVNLSAYLGFRLRGLPGATAATVCFLIPCFLLMLLLSHLYFNYGDLPLVSGLFHGLGALVVGLVCNTILNLWKSGVKTTFQLLMALVGFALVFWGKIGVIKILLIAGSAGLLMVFLNHRFYTLTYWTTRNWRDLWGRSAKLTGTPGTGGSKLTAKAAGVDREYISACSQIPLPLHWRQITGLVIWLALILIVDLFLINLRPDLLQMGSRFLSIGALVFGSGYAMLPFIQDTVVNQFNWLTNQQFAVALALSLITPGPVTIIGAFIGYKVAGVVGALVGMVNMYFPAWAMTTIVAAPFAKAGQIGQVRQVTGGIVAAFIGTLAVVMIKLAGSTLIDLPTMAMAAAAFAVQRFTKIDTVWIVLGGAVLSLMVFR